MKCIEFPFQVSIIDVYLKITIIDVTIIDVYLKPTNATQRNAKVVSKRVEKRVV